LHRRFAVLAALGNRVGGTVNNADYVRELRPLLPAEAFRPNRWAYVPIGIHLAIVAAGWTAARHAPSIWWLPLGLLVGNSLSVLCLYAHEVSHRSVTTNKYLLYPTEFLLWGLICIPATLWQRVHGAHHAHTNGDDDTDRRFLAHELTPVGMVAAAMMFPNRTLRYNVFCFLYGIVFPWRHTIAMLYPGRTKPDFVTAKPRYATADKIRIGFEFLFIVAFQLGLARFTHGAYFLVGVVPLLITSAVVASYVLTNHGLRPVDDGHDVLAASTTVVVPEFVNTLHSNFSYHTEHHLFPTMNAKYYPLVAALFKARFPDRYHCIPFSEAWHELWRNSIASPRRDAPAPAPAVRLTAEGQAEPAVAP
jgi:fatty acid desaturase